MKSIETWHEKIKQQVIKELMTTAVQLGVEIDRQTAEELLNRLVMKEVAEITKGYSVKGQNEPN